MKGTRSVYLPDGGGFGEVPVYDRYRLGASDGFAGPAIIEERESTVVINGPARVALDANRNLIVDLEAVP